MLLPVPATMEVMVKARAYSVHRRELIVAVAAVMSSRRSAPCHCAVAYRDKKIQPESPFSK